MQVVPAGHPATQAKEETGDADNQEIEAYSTIPQQHSQGDTDDQANQTYGTNSGLGGVNVGCQHKPQLVPPQEGEACIRGFTPAGMPLTCPAREQRGSARRRTGLGMRQ